MKKLSNILFYLSILILANCREECHDPTALNYSDKGDHKQCLCMYYDTVTFYTTNIINGPITIYFSASKNSVFDSIGTLNDTSAPANCGWGHSFPSKTNIENSEGFLILKDSISVDTVKFNFAKQKGCKLIDISEL